jgi:hypothetical protein
MRPEHVCMIRPKFRYTPVFTVPSLLTVYASGRSTRSSLHEEVPYGWSVVFADPAGNRIALYTAPEHSSKVLNARLFYSQQ